MTLRTDEPCGFSPNPDFTFAAEPHTYLRLIFIYDGGPKRVFCSSKRAKLLHTVVWF